VQKQVLVTPAQEAWSQILCDVNATPARISQIQNTLTAAGFNAGNSGKLDEMTMKAVEAYQKAKGLPMDGYLNVATVKSLGLSEK